MRKGRSIAGLLLGSALVCGCGWTPRDQFYQDRRARAVAQPGSGDRLTDRTGPRPVAVRSPDHSDR